LKQKNILDDLFVKTKNKIGMQEVLSFEIGGQTYKLTGNNKELTARAAHLVNNKFEIIKKQSVAATTRENIYMLSALNLAVNWSNWKYKKKTSKIMSKQK